MILLVPRAGIEPARCLQRGILSPVRLPIPPSRQRMSLLCYIQKLDASNFCEKSKICRFCGVLLKVTRFGKLLEFDLDALFCAIFFLEIILLSYPRQHSRRRLVLVFK